MNTMMRLRNSSDALALAEASLAGRETRAGEPRAGRLRSVLSIVGRIFDALPDEAGGIRRRDEALQVAALAATAPDGPGADALLADGYGPAVVEGVRRLTQDTGRLTFVQDSEDLARSGDAVLIAVRFAELSHDSRTDLVMRLPADERGVLGVYHKSRKALAAGLLDATGVDPRDVAGTEAGGPGDAAPPPAGPTLDEARAQAGDGLKGTASLAPALALLDRVARDGAELTLAEALEAMGRPGPDADAMAAIAFLTQGAKAALEARVVFVDERGLAHPLPPGAVERAGRDGFAHPVTGERVADPETRFFLRLAPRPGLLAAPAAEAAEASSAPPDAPAAGDPDARGAGAGDRGGPPEA